MHTYTDTRIHTGASEPAKCDKCAIHTYINTYIHVHTQALLVPPNVLSVPYIHTNIHTYIHTYIHVHTQALLNPPNVIGVQGGEPTMQNWDARK
jgi:hypothetical protein